jgi:hypothetical protein
MRNAITQNIKAYKKACLLLLLAHFLYLGKQKKLTADFCDLHAVCDCTYLAINF